VNPFYLVLVHGVRGWRWSARANNHEKLAQGEAYRNRPDMIRTLELLFEGTVELGNDGTTAVLWRKPTLRSIPIVIKR
jgi:hypothetical protein